MKNTIKRISLSFSLMLLLLAQQGISAMMLRKTATGTAFYLASRLVPRAVQHPLYKHTKPSFSSEVSLSTFRIDFTDNQHLYANDNQQLAVTVTVQKEVNYDYVPLTNAEKASITIAERSDNMQAGLPEGWNCDKAPNEYNQGLTTSSPMALDQTTENPHSVKRYLRTRKIGAQQFMATITLDNGTTYSTNQIEYDSYIAVTPTIPYQIRTNDLYFTGDQPAYNQNSVAVDLYYWTLPSGFSIVKQYFSDYIPHADTSKYYPFEKINTPSCICSGLIKKEVTALQVADFFPGMQQDYIPLDTSDMYIRGVQASTKRHTYPSPSYRPHITTSIIDNYGCVHTYHVYSRDHHRFLDIRDV